MPINRTYPIEVILAAAMWHAKATKTRVWLNYMLFQGFNDSVDDAVALADIVNSHKDLFGILITRPSHDLPKYKRGSVANLSKFQSVLKHYAPDALSSLFLPFGTHIGAGCGQFEFVPQNSLPEHESLGELETAPEISKALTTSEKFSNVTLSQTVGENPLRLCVPDLFCEEYSSGIAQILHSTPSSIYEVYGSLPVDDVIGSIRPIRSLPVIELSEFRSHIRNLHNLGIRFNYIANSTIMNNEVFTNKGKKNILKLTRYACYR